MILIRHRRLFTICDLFIFLWYSVIESGLLALQMIFNAYNLGLGVHEQQLFWGIIII